MKKSSAHASDIINTKQNKKKKRKTRRNLILSLISKLMPIILAAFFVVTICALLGRSSRFMYGYSSVMLGLLSNVASYFFAVFLLYHSLMWYYDVNRKICLRRVLCSLLFILTVSAAQHVLYIEKNALTDATFKTSQFYEMGQSNQGGGAIGGTIGGFLFNVIGKIPTIMIIVIIMLFVVLQMFNITPVSIFKSIFGNKLRQRKEQKSEQKVEKVKKHKKFEVFDDEDTYEMPVIGDKSIAELKNDGALLTELDDNHSSTQDYYTDTFTRTNINNVIEQAHPKVDTLPEEEEFFEEKDENQIEIDDAYIEHFSSNIGMETLPDDETEDNTPVEDNISEDDSSLDELINNEVDKNNQDDNLSETDDSLDDEPEEVEDEESTAPLFIKPQKIEKQEIKKPEKIEKPEPEKAKNPFIPYQFPPIELLDIKETGENSEDVKKELREKADIIVETLRSFNANTKVVNITRGPTVTRYELIPEPGVRVRAIANLADDIAMNLAAKGIRMECPIPGKSAIGIEVPNNITSMVYLRSLLEDPKFSTAKSKVTCAVGKSISGENIYVDIAKLIHLLVAGATGMGKSVCINALLISLLYKATPNELRLILIDPKRVEFSPFNGIPHLLVPVVCDVKKSIATLQWAVNEMEHRFKILEDNEVRDIGEYNDRVDRGVIKDSDKFARIIIVIDELYDLKMQVPEIDEYITRLTQKARAAGIHVIIGTQRPSVDVITGVIKANIPSRISFRVPALVDSRTVLDEAGAEKLVARGDMLIKASGALAPVRVQGAFISDDERERVLTYIKEHCSSDYDEEVMSTIDSISSKLQKADKSSTFGEGDEETGDELDDKFYEALEIAVNSGKISSSYLQRKLGLGFQRAARLIDQMEEKGYIGEANGSKPRDVLISKQEYYDLRMRNEE